MRRIVFAHTDPKLIQIYLNYLRPHFNVDSASDGLSALRFIRISKPDAVVSDFNLPNLSGIGLLRFIRTTPEYSLTPFLFLTNHHDNSEALNLGANDWLDAHSSHPDILLDRIYRQLRVYHGI